jgi:hypothetical protein
MASRLGLIGPIIVIVGAAIAGVGVWYVVHARPVAGTVIDTIAIDHGESLVVRDEAGGDRSFLELHHGDELAWQALIPHYIGAKNRPAVAWSDTAITVRVEREGRAEVFALSRHDSAKLGGFRLAEEHEPIRVEPTGPITLTDHVRSYEIVGGADWHQLIAIDLRTGRPLWKVGIGKFPVTDGGVDSGKVWVVQDGIRRKFWVFTGKIDTSPDEPKPSQIQ